MIPEWMLRMLGLTPARERALAVASLRHDERALRRELETDEDAFERVMRERERVPHVVIGESNGVPYRLPLDALATHLWGTAATGAGKSRWACSLLDRLIDQMERGERRAIILLDAKGETAELLLRGIAHRAERRSEREREALARRLMVVRPFRGPFVAPCQILAREAGIDLMAQARSVLETLRHTLGVDVGIRQTACGINVFATAIASGLTLHELAFLLHDAGELARLSESTGLARVVHYFRDGYARESRQTIDGIAARIDAVLGSEAASLIAAGPEALDTARMFEPGTITVVDLGAPPLGAEATACALGALFFARIAWRVFDERRRRDADVVLVADELQQILTPSVAESVDRLVSQGRSFRTALVSLHQTTAQAPTLERILAANVRLRLIGRSSARDLASVAEWLPVTGRRVRPRSPGEPRRERVALQSPAEELRRWERSLGTLPRRTFLFADREAPFPARLIEAPTYDPPQWSAISARVRELVERGAVGVPRDEMRKRVARIEQAAARRRAAPSNVVDLRDHRRRRRSTTTAAAELDLVGDGEERSGRRGLP